jgi:hypothetical protein
MDGGVPQSAPVQKVAAESVDGSAVTGGGLIMRKLTNTDLTNIAGTTVMGYHVEGVRVKRGPFSDSDHYGYILGRSTEGYYVCWQFHLDENEKPNVYWGHYFMEDRNAALWDFDTRDLGSRTFTVTITETLKLTVEVEAKDQSEAEQIVSDNWNNSEYILDADNFVGVEFEAIPVDKQDGS